MSGVSTSDPIKQLLGILADPAAYKKQLADYAAAKDAAEAAEVKLSQTRDSLDREVAKHQATVDAHNAWVADFQATKTRVLETDATLADRESAVAKRETDLSEALKVHVQAANDLKVMYETKKAELDKREAAVGGREDKVADREMIIAAKEKSIANKLARLQEIVG